MVVTQALIVDEMDAMKGERFRCFSSGIVSAYLIT
jgi:hypothetical protein